jgi:SAM-dependent methyltransferase
MASTAARCVLAYDGERMVPEAADHLTFWEHIYRYKFACKFARYQRVLDVACGEGYGAAALAIAGARSVVGVDVSEEACHHAREKYGLDARQGDATRLPLPDASVDLVVSFETIEHIHEPEAFVAECRRILVAGGRLLISTPNRPVYSPGGLHNPFHVHEMDELGFSALIGANFRRIRLYTQGIESASPWSIRSLAARRSCWSDLRGYWRMRQAFCQCLRSGQWNDEVVECYRNDPVQCVLARDLPASALFNPFAIRRRSFISNEYYKYILINAKK